MRKVLTAFIAAISIGAATITIPAQRKLGGAGVRRWRVESLPVRSLAVRSRLALVPACQVLTAGTAPSDKLSAKHLFWKNVCGCTGGQRYLSGSVPLAPTASIARHDDHRTDVNPVRCFN